MYNLDRRNRHHSNIVQKYGVNNISVRRIKTFLTESAAFKHEREMIACLRAFNYAICNRTDGGEGISGFVHSAHSRAKMRNAHLGMTHSDAARAKISAVQVGRTASPETRAKISAFMKGRVPNSAARTKMSKAKKGIAKSDSTRAKMSAAHKARWASRK